MNDKYKPWRKPDGKPSQASICEDDFITMPQWQKIRMDVLKRDNFRCRQCGAPYQIQVHHMRYPSVWGDENIDDLVTLCDECHKGVHRK